jgi:hypothetical protein
MNQVNELTFRIPGMNETDVQSLAKEVSDHLAAQLPQVESDLKISEIKIQLTEAQIARSEGLASHISSQIIRQINNAI